LQGSYQSLVSQAANADAVSERRRQLRAAINRACDVSIEADTPPRNKLNGNGRLVCVRSCDGGYFPLESQPAGKGSVTALCSALCPNAEVMVFHAPREGGIGEAVSESGEPYMKLPNALRYRKAYDPSCFCKKPTESWAHALRKAESMIARKKSDVLVTAAISGLMTNAMLRRPKARRDKAEVRAPGPASATARGPTSREPATTGSVEANTSPARQGRTIRVIAPDIIPVPVP
jgi:hypothetical protein